MALTVGCVRKSESYCYIRPRAKLKKKTARKWKNFLFVLSLLALLSHKLPSGSFDVKTLRILISRALWPSGLLCCDGRSRPTFFFALKRALHHHHLSCSIFAFLPSSRTLPKQRGRGKKLRLFARRGRKNIYEELRQGNTRPEIKCGINRANVEQSSDRFSLGSSVV